MINKPYSESCDQNREVIGQLIEPFLNGRASVLEIGSGTGQHAVYFASQFPYIRWQTSDLTENHGAIQAWIDDSHLDNVLSPIALDSTGLWPDRQYDILYTANTVHIMSAFEVEKLFINMPACMYDSSLFLLYGPFNYQGQYTAESNARFDQWLKRRDPHSGIKNFEWLAELGQQTGLNCIHDFDMPANNRMLVWENRSGIFRN